MKISEVLQNGHFVITSELGPPKGVDTGPMLEEVEHLRSRVTAVNVTDQQSSVMRLGSLAVCRLLKEREIESIFQMTCRDRNRIALQSDLLSAAALGIQNVLCLTGDYVSLGDHPDAKPVFDLDSVSLLYTAKQMMEGHDLSGAELTGNPDFCLGAVVSPAAEPLEPQLVKMERKVRAGACFFQTQAVYDPEQFARFVDQAKHFNVPILVGIIPLKSAGMARFMNRNVAGVNVPEGLIDEMANATDRLAKSVEICARLIREMKDLCQGVHLMPVGWEKHVPTILDAADL